MHAENARHPTSQHEKPTHGAKLHLEMVEEVRYCSDTNQKKGKRKAAAKTPALPTSTPT
jgi:hypothetical protein